MSATRSAWSLFLLMAAVAGPAGGEQAAAGKGEIFVDTIDVAVASLEVYVEDGDGRPVRGLRSQDFELLMDGGSIPLSNFYEVDGGRRVLAEATDLEGEVGRENVSTSLILYVDNVNLSAFHRNRSLFKVRDFLGQRLARGDRAMVVSFAGALHVEQPLTRSIEEITQALARVAQMSLVDDGPDARRRKGMDELVSLHRILAGDGTKRGDDPCAAQLGELARTHARADYDLVKRSVEALGRFTDSLSGLPGRKALLYLSDGLSLHPGQEAFEFLRQVCGGGAAASGLAGGGFDFSGKFEPGKVNVAALANEGVSFSAAELLTELADRANANTVSLFALEAAGPRQAGAGAETSSIVESLSGVQTVAVQNLQDSLFQMAEETGGRAVLNAGDLGPGLAAVAGDLDTFYSLGYRFEPQGRRAHAIEVKVNRPGARVRYRKSFTAKDAATLLADRTLGALVYGVEENPLGVRVETGEVVRLDSDLNAVPIRVRIPLGKLVFLPSEGRHVGRLIVQVAARDRDGRLAPVRAVEVPLSIAADRFAEARGKVYLYEVKMLMRAGDHSVAVGISDELGQQSSFVLAQVPVVSPGGETVN